MPRMSIDKEYRKARTIDKKKQQARDIAEGMIDHDSTVRQLSKEFMMSRSTVHRRLTKTLKELDSELYSQCQKILHTHKQEAPARGGKGNRTRRA